MSGTWCRSVGRQHTLPQLPPDLADRIPPPINVGLDLDLGESTMQGLGICNKFSR